MKKTLTTIIILGLILASFYLGYKISPTKTITYSDTVKIVKIDTIKIIKPIYITEIRVDSIPYQVTDTIKIGDTIYLPKTQKEYRDSTYRAWVSGYQPNLDSIKVYPKTLIQTITKTQQVKSSRFGIGISTGVGYFGDGLKPYIGIGLNYNLIKLK